MGKTAKQPAKPKTTAKTRATGATQLTRNTGRKPAAADPAPNTISITEPYQRPPIQLGLLKGKIHETDPNWWKSNEGEGWDEYLT